MSHRFAFNFPHQKLEHWKRRLVLWCSPVIRKHVDNSGYSCFGLCLGPRHCCVPTWSPKKFRFTRISIKLFVNGGLCCRTKRNLLFTLGVLPSLQSFFRHRAKQLLAVLIQLPFPEDMSWKCAALIIHWMNHKADPQFLTCHHRGCPAFQLEDVYGIPRTQSPKTFISI